MPATFLCGRRRRCFTAALLAPPASAKPNGELNELMQDTLTGAAVRDVPFFDPKRVAALVAALPRAAPEDRAALDFPLMSVLSVALMNREFRMTSAAWKNGFCVSSGASAYPQVETDQTSTIR